jgi:hypothetical protein
MLETFPLKSEMSGSVILADVVKKRRPKGSRSNKMATLGSTAQQIKFYFMRLLWLIKIDDHTITYIQLIKDTIFNRVRDH